MQNRTSYSSIPHWLFIAVLVFICLNLGLRFQKPGENAPSAVQIRAYPIETPTEKAVVIDQTTSLDTLDLSPAMYYFFDTENRYPDPTTEELTDPESSFFQEFIHTEGRVNWGSHEEVCWFRIELRSELQQDRGLYASNLVDHKAFTLPAGGGTVLYYRLEYNDASIVATPSIRDEAIHQAKIQNRMVYAAILLGVYIGLFLYNLFLAISTGNPSYPPYLAGIVFFSLYLLFREFDVSLWGWDIASAHFTLAAYLSMLLFAGQFFAINRNRPGLWYSFFGMLSLGGVILLIGLYSPGLGTILKYVFSILLLLYAFWMSISYFTEQRQKSILFFLSWLPALICLFFSVAASLHLAEFPEGSVAAFLGSNPSMYLQVAIQMILLSIALGNAINEEQKGRRRALMETAALKKEAAGRKDFILHITHELRTVLMVISGNISGLQTGKLGTLDSKALSAVNSAKQGIRTLEEHIDNLLAFTQIQSGIHPIKRVTLDISPYLRSLCCSFESLAEVQNIDLQIHVFENRMVGADLNPHLFSLIINNLMSNAFKYTKEGGWIRVDLEEHPQKPDGLFRIKICNSGQAIPKQSREKIFEKFTRVSSGDADQPAGLGIGLFVVKQAAALLGGDASIDTTNHYPCFYVDLPISQEPIQDLPPTAEPEHQQSTTKEGKGYHILLVEDNQELHALISQELRQEFTVTGAHDGLHALNLLKNEEIRPDLIISDILMPNLDGFSFFTEVREKRNMLIPFMFLSAIDQVEHKEKLYTAGAVDFIQKPFDLDTLRAKVRNLLHWKQEELETQKEELRSLVMAVFESNPTSSNLQTLDMCRYGLTPREREVVTLVLQGLRDKEVAAKLELSTSTISNTLQRVYKKTQTQGRTGLIRLFLGSTSNE